MTTAPYAAHAATRSSGPSLVRTQFQLRVASNLPAGTTLWVAYGPLGGKFGLIRLHSTGPGRFVASGRFPSGARADFAYIEGQGTMRTRQGIVPGNPVHTVGHVGPLVIGRQAVPLFRLPATAG